jgi:bisphosphoglycerate-dependent phosphoglycerate mutase
VSDLIFTTDGKETFRMPSRTIQELTIGTKCPETKLEIKMTEKITLELTLEELKMIDKYVEKTDDTYSVLMKIKNAYPVRSHIEEAYKEWCGEYPSGPPSEDAKWDAFLNGYWVTQPKAKPMNEVLDRLENKYKQAEENAASYITDEVIDRMVKKYQVQKLWNRVRDELGYSVDCCDEIVNLVESWLPDPQSAAGSQNLDTELLVDGFNDCVRKMKEMLR